MFNVCPHCGQYSVDREMDPTGPVAICPFCGHRQPFLRLPLFILTGASGTGKSTIALRLAPALRREAVVMEGDILWRPEFNTPDDNFRAFHEVWLRLAKNVNQSGVPMIFVGTAVPEQYESQPERRYISTVHYLALVADDTDLTARLRARLAWRDTHSDEFIDRMIQFNHWLRDHAALTNPPMDLLDTSRVSLDESLQRVVEWFRERTDDGESTRNVTGR